MQNAEARAEKLPQGPRKLEAPEDEKLDSQICLSFGLFIEHNVLGMRASAQSTLDPPA